LGPVVPLARPLPCLAVPARCSFLFDFQSRRLSSILIAANVIVSWLCSWPCGHFFDFSVRDSECTFCLSIIHPRVCPQCCGLLFTTSLFPRRGPHQSHLFGGALPWLPLDLRGSLAHPFLRLPQCRNGCFVQSTLFWRVGRTYLGVKLKVRRRTDALAVSISPSLWSLWFRVLPRLSLLWALTYFSRWTRALICHSGQLTFPRIFSFMAWFVSVPSRCKAVPPVGYVPRHPREVPPPVWIVVGAATDHQVVSPSAFCSPGSLFILPTAPLFFPFVVPRPHCFSRLTDSPLPRAAAHRRLSIDSTRRFPPSPALTPPAYIMAGLAYSLFS